MVYGIDLGTTNSLIGANNRLISGLVSSRVDLERKCVIDRNSWSNHALSSYKINMGLDSLGRQAIEASTIVLNELKRIVLEKEGEVVKDVIITVPAYFSTNQREAVRIAAANAGMNLVNLLNEPTAAAISECNSQNGTFLIYDLGGGTFDCTLVNVSLGYYSVLGTDGLVLGGDNLDTAILNEFISSNSIPIYKQTKEFISIWRDICRDMKEEMQANGYYISSMRSYEDYSFTLTPEKYKELVRNVFSPTIGVVHSLITTRLPADTKFNICFVGGSTYCSYLTEYISSELGLSYSDVLIAKNPNYSVVNGVIKYATDGNLVELQDITKQISIEVSDGSLYPIIQANSNVPCSGRRLAVNTETSDKLVLKVYQGNSRVARDEDFIGMLVYDYREVVEKGEGEVDVVIKVDLSGLIEVEAECISTFSGLQKVSLKL